MTHLVQSLRQDLSLPSFDTVVHLGAGPYFVPDLYEQLSAGRFVLVDADPQACETLRGCVPSDRYAIHARFLCPASGKRSFHRYNLASLNGPLLPGALAEIYPRLRDTETLELDASAIDDFLAEITTSDQAAHCLILDLPGQEGALVAAVNEEILHRFDWILVRGAGQLRMEHANPIEETTKALTQAGFSRCDLKHAEDSLYPLAAYHLDRNALQIRRLQDACMMLKAHVGELEAAKKETAKTFDQQLADLTGQLDARTQERDSLTSEKNAVHAQLSTLASERDQLKKSAGDHHSALASARQELEALKAQFTETEKKRTDLAGLLDARTQERDALATEKTAVHAQLSTLAAERDQLKKTAGDHHSALASARQELEALKAQFAETEKKRADLAGQLDARTQERDSLASEKNAVHAQLSTLAAERDQLKKSAGDHHNALASAKQELEALKAQFAETEKKRADLAGLLDARTQERDSLTSEKNAVHAQLSSLAAERDQLKKTAGDHHSALASARQELEALKAQFAETEKKRADLTGLLDARTQERDQSRIGLETLTKERDQLKKTVADRSSRIAELEAQTADQAERQLQIDEQMVRAEAQLEMLKDFMRPSFD